MRALGVIALLVACNGGNSGQKDAPTQQHDAKVADAKVFMDARPPDAPQHVLVVSPCPANPDATVTATSTLPYSYVQQTTTISVNQIVQFTMPAIHDVVPGHAPADTSIADPGMLVNFGATTCLKFTVAGTYGFHCSPHLFNGTIIVQ